MNSTSNSNNDSENDNKNDNNDDDNNKKNNCTIIAIHQKRKRKGEREIENGLCVGA